MGVDPRQAFDIQNKNRTQARDLMADRKEAARLNEDELNLTWKQMLLRAEERGYQADARYKYILGASQRTRPSVNKTFGIE